MYIYKDKNLIYKKHFGIALDNLMYEELIKPLIDQSFSTEIEDVQYKDYYKFRFSYSLKNDYFFLFINSINDVFEKVKKEFNHFKEEFFELVETNSFTFDNEKNIEKIERLIYIIQNKFPPIISLVGYSGVGKTTITNLLRTKEIAIEPDPKISAEVVTLKVGPLYFFIRDFADDEKIGFLWNNFIRDSDAVFIITDSTLKNVEASKLFLKKIEEEVPYAYTIGIANKQDLENAILVSRVQEILEIDSYPVIAIDPNYKHNLILIISEILKMKQNILPLIDSFFEKEKLINELEDTIKNENLEDIDTLLKKLINLSSKLGDNVEPFYRLQLKMKEGIKKIESTDIRSTLGSQTLTQENQYKGLSYLETSLKMLIRNFMDELEGIIAIIICDREGLIITSESKGEAGDESVLGAIAASVDSYIDRIKKEFEEQTTFFNITTISDKKFSYCSMGLKSILLTISDLTSSDTELRVFSEHIAGKVEMILEGNENVSLEIPEIVKTLSKTKDGKIPTGDYSLKLIIVGDYKVGKTSLIFRFVKNLFKESYHSTVGVEISKKTVELAKNTKVNFAIWDVGGQITQMSPYRKRFYEGANAAFIVIDRTKQDSLDSFQKWYNEITRFIGKKVNTIIVGNKSDLEDKIIISEEQIKKLANHHNFHYILTSAKTGENVNESFFYIAYRFLASTS
ncbi:MAG: ADP-ribosylation factor-like protein [Promethearchaeota archaeon]